MAVKVLNFTIFVLIKFLLVDSLTVLNRHCAKPQNVTSSTQKDHPKYSSRCGQDVHSLQPAPDLQRFAPKRAPSLAKRAWPHFGLCTRHATRIRLRCAECWPKQDNRSNNFCASLTTRRNALYQVMKRRF